jgi:diphthine synthase
MFWKDFSGVKSLWVQTPGMLYMVGLGLDDGEVTEKGRKALEEAERIFVEFYTNTETVDLGALEDEFGEIQRLSRKEVEREDRILESAKEEKTAFLVSGDPLTATTHYDIKHRAENEGFKVDVCHAPSILTSVAETGLNLYKFGRVVTLPENSRPESILEHIDGNDSIGLHTLILLDIDYDAEEAAEKLVEMRPELETRESVLVERLNQENEEVSTGNLGELEAQGDTPHSIILVGGTSHKEEQFLESHKKF